MHCGKCGKIIKAGDEFRHGKDVLCEDCCIDVRMPQTRKTHWQYLSCFKTQFLSKAD
jgi:hypothetical protein